MSPRVRRGAHAGRGPGPFVRHRRGVHWTVEHDAAARLLGVTAGVLAVWTTRFGFPQPMLVDGNQPSYSRRELIALRDALAAELSIPSAIAHAQDALRGSRERS